MVKKSLLFALGILILAYQAHADVSTFPWSTTFDYAECTQRGGGGATDCATVADDGVTWNWGDAALGGNYTQVSSAANYSGGAGGNGFRSWVADGDNQNSGPVKVQFTTDQTEVWIRWYQRYQVGFAWNTLIYDKTLYIRTSDTIGDPDSTDFLPEFYGTGYLFVAQKAVPDNVLSTAYGWSDVMGGATSDGQFHCFEVHIKVDTDSTNGVVQIWIDGDLKAEADNLDLSYGYAKARDGINFFDFHGNQKTPSNGGQIVYVDYDDIAIYNTTPPNTDAYGNPYIGPLGADVTPPTPSAFAVNDSTVSMTFDETVTDNGVTNEFVLTCSVSGAQIITIVSGSGTANWQGSVSSGIANGETCTAAFNGEVGKVVKDDAGNPMADFTGFSVDVNTPASPPAVIFQRNAIILGDGPAINLGSGNVPAYLGGN